MTTVTPDVLTSIDSSAGYAGSYEYKHRSSITGYEVYGLHYLNGNGFHTTVYDIKVDTSTNTWYDHGSGNPVTVSLVGSEIHLFDAPPGNNLLYAFTRPTTASWISSGPTVTSITDDTIFVPSDTVTNTDFTLLKNGSAYANTNISLTGPGAQPPSDARGYTYNLTYDGTASYRATIDSKSYEELYYDDSWTSSPSSGRSTNSNRILNVLATIPANTNIYNGSNSVTSVFSNNGRVLTHTYTADLSSIGESANTTIDIIFFVEQRLVNNVQEIVGVFYEMRSADGIRNYWNSSPVYIIGNQETMTRTSYLLGVATTFSVTDWVYEDEPEGDGYIAPVTTTSNGGRKRRYPIISTNLFDRQRSIYSIGNTHKDETLF